MNEILKKNKLLIILFITTIISYFLINDFFKIFLFTFFAVLLIKLGIKIKRKIFWKIRNRLIFSSLFFIITPIFFITIFYYVIINVLLAQHNLSVFQDMIRNEIESINRATNNYLNFKNQEDMINRIKTILKYNRSDIIILFYKKQNNHYVNFFKYPKDINLNKIHIIKHKGFFKISNRFYYGSFNLKNKRAVFIGIELNKQILKEFSHVGDFNLSLAKSINNINIRIDDKNGILPWPYLFKYINLEDKSSTKKTLYTHYFLLKMNFSKILIKLKHTNSGMLNKILTPFLYFLGGLFGLFILISFLIGFKIIRVVTKSLNSLTKGIERIRKGDFSYRLNIKSGDQLQYLAESFNEMASGIERLLIEETEKNRLEEELRIARTIQLKLLPDDEFENDKIEVSAINIPAKEIAGDYFDYYLNEKKEFYFLVADVSGKGSSAAFYMAELKGLVTFLQKNNYSTSDIIIRAHNTLIQTLDKSTFITMNIGKLNLNKMEFVFSRAGHTPILYFNSSTKRVTSFKPKGKAIGLINKEKEIIEEKMIKLKKDDIIVFYSDGLSEIMNKENELLGEKNIMNIIKMNSNKNAKALKEEILNFTINYSNKNHYEDDLTFIIVKIK